VWNGGFALGNNITTTLNNSVALGSNSAMQGALTAQTAGTTAYSSSTINGNTYNYAGGTPAGVVMKAQPPRRACEMTGFRHFATRARYAGRLAPALLFRSNIHRNELP
jgi:hypothetical protein